MTKVDAREVITLRQLKSGREKMIAILKSMCSETCEFREYLEGQREAEDGGWDPDGGEHADVGASEMGCDNYTGEEEDFG
jgi:hypothetical protein